jgi:hypothetical protein
MATMVIGEEMVDIKGEQVNLLANIGNNLMLDILKR